MNDSSAFQRLDGAGNDRKSLKRHKGTVIGPQLDHSFLSAVVLGGNMSSKSRLLRARCWAAGTACLAASLILDRLEGTPLQIAS
jgi:hypothetical protein